MGTIATGERRQALGGFAFALALFLLPHITIEAQGVAPAGSAVDSASLSVVRSYFAAYNTHDINAVLQFISPDFVWLSLAGDSITVEVRGAQAVRAGLIDYFRRLPSAQSDIEAATTLGPWVSVRERARWVGANGPRSQAALSVYEVRGGLLRRLWYYPEVRE